MDREPGPAACPATGLGAEYDPFGSSTTYEIFRRARASEPVFYCPEINYWVVTRREDIRAVFADPDTYSAQITLAPVTPFSDAVVALLAQGGFRAQPVQSNLDGADHTRIRAVSAQILNHKYYQTLEPAIRRIAADFIDRWAGRGRIDLVADLVYEFPAHVLFLILGIPDSDAARIKRWADNRLLMTFGRLDPAEQLVCARDMLAYWKYCEALVADRLEAPRDDYPSHLLRVRNGDGQIISINEITSVVFGLLLAGHETTTNLSANAFHALLTHRAQWQAICADASLIPNAVEETLRFRSSVICWRRKTMKPVEVAGVAIPAGANLLLALASANHDEAVFAEPDRFDVRRADARGHLAFGFGKHFCIGAPLARLELRVLLEEVSARYPHMTLCGDQDIEMIRTVAFRGPKRLLADLNAAAI